MRQIRRKNMFGRKSVYGRLIESTPSKEHVNRYTVRHGAAQPKTNKATDTFEQEYQEFIKSLIAKKETNNPETTIECVVDEPVVEEPVETVVEEPVVQEQPKKSRKKKSEPVVETETVVEDENKQEITEEA